ncbi:hypothetical protein EV183_004013 [Coemansia sp. RSA 2336]|nr:hypothetical protein EV183_004013 [Coemansia sp. RSA 2336]
MSSIAQRLPYEIIEGIGKCVLPTPHCFGSEGRALSAKLTLSTEFIALMSLCRVPTRLSATGMAINNMVDEAAPVFIQKQITWLYLHRFSTRPLLSINTMPTGLNSLVLQCTLSTNLDYELVIRNAATLEHLQITCLQESFVSTLVYAAEFPKCTRVYAQLRRLVIDSHLNQSMSLPQANPFPKLHTLICRGTFPFNSPHLFYSGLLQFHHLDIDVNLDLMNMFLGNKVLDKFAFKNLCYLRLGWTKSNQHNFTKERAKMLIKAAIELSSKTRVLSLYNSYGPDIGNVFESVNLPRYLKQLYMPAIPLSMDNLVDLLDKLKHLESATACVLCGLKCLESTGPSREHIHEYQQRYKQNKASVYNLRVKAAGYEHSRKVAETAVLLADILPNIYRMSIYSDSKASTDQLQHIEQARSQAAYQGNLRLASVKFSVLSEWPF